MSDPLHVLAPEHWPGAVTLYPGVPGYMARVTIKAQIYNVEDNPNFPVKVYSPYGQPDIGIVFIWRLDEIGYEISIFSNKNDKTKLATAIENSNVIDWTSPLMFCNMLPEVQIMTQKILNKKGYTYNDNGKYIAKMQMEKALDYEIKVPLDIRLETLGVEHAEEIDNLWIYRYPGSLYYFKGMLERGSALGIIGKADGKLRGWILRSARGDLHALHVKTEYRRRGYAQLLVRTLSKTIARRNSDVFGCINIDNIPSRELFRKLGFELSVIVNWMNCKLK